LRPEKLANDKKKGELSFAFCFGWWWVLRGSNSRPTPC